MSTYYLQILSVGSVRPWTTTAAYLLLYKVQKTEQSKALHRTQCLSWLTWRVEHVVQFEVVPHVMEGCWRHVQDDLTGGGLVGVDMVGRVGPG